MGHDFSSVPPETKPATDSTAEASRVGKQVLTDGSADEVEAGDSGSLLDAAHWEHVDDEQVDNVLPKFATMSAKTGPTPKAPKPPVRKAKVTEVKAATAYDKFVVKPAAPKVYDPLAGKKTVGGQDLATVDTKPEEATVLNALRAEPKRFNAPALIVAQQNLQVANASGAFNTETLRQLRKNSTDARFANLKKVPEMVAAILDDAVWTKFHTTPNVDLFITAPAATDAKTADTNAKRKADLVVQAMGYESFVEYKKILQPFTFLGMTPSVGANVHAENLAHPHLIARLKAAEAFLRQRHGANVKPSDLRWAGLLTGTYHAIEADVDQDLCDFHTLGLAVDFDPSQNGWLYPESVQSSGAYGIHAAKKKTIDESNKKKAPEEALEDVPDPTGIAREWVKEKTTQVDVAFAQAAYLFDAVVMTKAMMLDWSRTLSTEELHARLLSASVALKQYIALASKQGNDQEIIDLFKSKGFTEKQAQDALPGMREFPGYYNKFGRTPTKGQPVNHSLDLMVALRDVAGLNYGGSEMSSDDNGDFMHYDTRNDSVGKVALAKMLSLLSYKHPKTPAAKTPTPAK